MPEISSVTLILKPQREARIPGWLGRAAQANFLHTLKTFQPDLSAAIHDASGAKPFTSSTLIGARKQGDMTIIRNNDTLRLRYTTIHPQVTAVLHQVILPQWKRDNITLHNQPLKVATIQSDGDHSDWNNQVDYVQLVDHAPTHHKVTLSFTSPTAFKRTAGHFTPLPQPELVFSGLLDRWNAFAPFRLPDQLYDVFHNDVVVDYARIQTETLTFARGRKGIITGYTGKVTYRFLCDRETRRYLHALAQFAKYSGIGVKTSVGMGQARVV